MRVCPSCFGLYGADQTRCPKDRTPTEDSVQVLVGRSLGSYTVRALIGEGGMGVVYAGEHLTIGRRVALKVLRPELSLRDDIVERFIQEARAVSTIGHANIVNIYDFGRTPFGSFYFVMEYLEGKTLRAVLDEEGPQPLERVVTVATAVGAALTAAHNKGFVHRDVKPENIMLLDRKGTLAIKLLDFGIVKLLTHEQGPTTHTGMAMGTPQYMCPEQLEDMTLDPRADVYSLGAVCYEMLSGRVPYPGKSPAEVRQLQLTQTPPPPSTFRPGSRRLDAAILWALAPDPGIRCTRIEDFLATLQEGYQEALNPETRATPGRPSRRAFVIKAAAVSVVALCAGAASVLLWPEKDDPRRPTTQPTAQRPDARAQASLSLPQARAAALARVREALRSGADHAAVTELLAEMVRPMTAVRTELREVLEHDPNPEVRRAAARSLARIPDEDRASARALRRILEGDLRDAWGRNAWDLAEALHALGDETGLARLRRDFARPVSRERAFQRSFVLEALGRRRDGTQREEMWSLSQKTMDRPTRIRLLGYLAALGDARARRALDRMLESEDWPGRVEAAEALLPLERNRALEILARALDQTRDASQVRAACALAQFGDARGANILLQSLRSSDVGSQVRSALALGHLADPAIRGELTRALGQQAERVRLAAAVALLPEEDGRKPE